MSTPIAFHRSLAFALLALFLPRPTARVAAAVLVFALLAFTVTGAWAIRSGRIA